MHLPAILSRSLLALCALGSLASVQAGGFGGPAPFRNGSPLLTGTDGIYQAVASAKNLTGLISWSVRGGVQSSSVNDNTWIMYVDGAVLSGQPSVNISNDKITGVLDSSFTKGLPTNEDGTVDLPIVFVVPGNAGAGYFRANIDLQSPITAFNGTGEIKGTPGRTDQIVFLNSGTSGLFFGGTLAVVIPGSDLDKATFKIRGTRLSTTTSSNR